MKKVSSRSTFFYKYLFPHLWLGILGLFALGAVSTVANQRSLNWETAFACAVPLLMAAFGIAIFRSFASNLADEVWDDVDSLVVKNGNIVERIPLTDIVEIEFRRYKPERIKLRIQPQTQLGESVSFLPAIRMLQIEPHPTAVDLAKRIATR